MPSLLHRSYQKEFLDRDDIPFPDIQKNMQELDVINRKLGGHRVTLQGIKSLLQNNNYNADRPLYIVETGCGGGDNLRAIKQWALKSKVHVIATGIDINPECIAFARSQPENAGIEFLVSDYRYAQLPQKPDIIFSSLFCHHFHEDDLVFMLQWMQRNSSIGFFINDLHRHTIAYYSIKLLTAFFSGSYLVKNDAPLSVQRGFKKHEWNALFREAGISSYKCQWQWAFRWLITCKHHAPE